MDKSQVFRVGICGCTNQFHGKLRGKRTVIAQLRDKRLTQPQAFSLEEVAVPNGYYPFRATLRKYRCHFFLDVHEIGRGCYKTTLAMVELIPSRTQRGIVERLYVGTFPFKFWQANNKEWMRRRRVPTAEEIMRGITDLIKKMGEARFRKWLARMSPVHEGPCTTKTA